MRHIFKALTVFILMILQSTFCHFIGIMGIIPNLMIACTVSMALTADSFVQAGVYGLAAGILWDLLWGRTFGVYALLFLYVALLIYHAGEYLYKKSLLICVSFTFIAAIVTETAFYIVSFVIGRHAPLWHIFFRTIVPSAAYTAIAQIVIYSLCVKISGIGKGRSEGA